MKETLEKRTNKGITLIALVVTIIVLLILAGISIQMLVGEGGILINAKDASSETKKANAKESIDLEIADAILEDKELTAEGLNKHFNAHLPNLTHGGQSLEDNPITEFPAIVELDGFAFQIDEYGKTKEVNGIILSKNSLKLQIEVSGDERTYGEEILTATLAGISGDITWNTEGDAVQVDELEGGKSVNVLAQKAGEAKITATCSEKTAECSVTVEEVINPYIDNSYVQYDVEYTDVYTNTEYTKNTGWRAITDLTSYEEAKEYEGPVDIISTGIPTKLNYCLSEVSRAKWAGTDTDGEKYLNEYSYSQRQKTDNNIRAVSGLLYNFKKIVFSGSSSHNRGGFVNIVTNGTSAVEDANTTGESLFTAKISSGTIKGIRSVHLGDIKGTNDETTGTNSITSDKDKKQGLFELGDYTPDIHRSGSYWLASPNPSDDYGLRFVQTSGIIRDGDGNYTHEYGMRPVVSISDVHMKLNGHVWEIIE